MTLGHRILETFRDQQPHLFPLEPFAVLVDEVTEQESECEVSTGSIGTFIEGRSTAILQNCTYGFTPSCSKICQNGM